jgi:hypothetical protein
MIKIVISIALTCASLYRQLAVQPPNTSAESADHVISCGGACSAALNQQDRLGFTLLLLFWAHRSLDQLAIAEGWHERG